MSETQSLITDLNRKCGIKMAPSRLFFSIRKRGWKTVWYVQMETRHIGEIGWRSFCSQEWRFISRCLRFGQRLTRIIIDD